MIIYDSQGREINIRPDSPSVPTWRSVADRLGLRVVTRTEVVYTSFGKKTFTFYDIYRGDNLIAIE